MPCRTVEQRNDVAGEASRALVESLRGDDAVLATIDEPPIEVPERVAERPVQYRESVAVHRGDRQMPTGRASDPEHHVFPIRKHERQRDVVEMRVRLETGDAFARGAGRAYEPHGAA